MSLLLPGEVYYLNFVGRIEPRSLAYAPKERAYEDLRRYTGEDFGDDAEAWLAWLLEAGVVRVSMTAEASEGDWAKDASGAQGE